jgi:multidrug efflux system membrane fusion protein
MLAGGMAVGRCMTVLASHSGIFPEIVPFSQCLLVGRSVLKVLVLLSLIAGGAYWYATSPKQAAEQKPARAAAPVAVSVATASREDMPIFLSALGSVQAANTVQIRPMIEGPLQKVAFTEGQEVKRGDVLAIIDPRVYKASLDQARAKLAQDQAQLDSDRRDLERNTQLAERSFASKQVVDQQRAAVAKGEALIEADQAAIQSAQVQLDYTTIIAPFDGRVGIRGVDAGNIVRPTDATPIATLTQHQPISVLFSLPEFQLRKAQGSGQGEILAYDPEGSSRIATGTLQVVDNQIDPQTGTIRVKAEFENEDNALWPGQFVPVKVRITVRQGIVALPSAAIQRGPEGLYVWVTGPDKKAKMAPIKAGPVQDDKTIIESGISPGDRIITAGQYRLQPNSAVQFEEPKLSATEPAAPQGGLAR